MKIAKKFFALAVMAALCASSFAQYVETRKDQNGWRLFVDNKQIEVKGMVWSYTPIGENYTYNLWSKSDDEIMRMIDTDMPLLKAMGVNTIRCFSDIPPRWIEYIYTKYGIYTMVNDLLGRYGTNVNGKWFAQTDYSDRNTRKALVEQAKRTADRYRTTKGVLMYMFGNESNYGLVWSGSNIENLPTGEQNSVKAGYLYSLLEEAMAACKEIDPLRPVGFINGDTQYLDLIKQLCPSLDILGVNAYRGFRFYDSFYEGIAETIDKPVVFTEAGADAFNALTNQEDQYSQALYLREQWKEMYGEAYGKGKSGNILGGYVFEWADEWWKHYQTKNLAVHDTDGTWANAGYELDYRIGVNNMNEEWFGIVAQSKSTDGGISRRVPRAAYYMLSDIWKLSLYDSTQEEIDKTFASLDSAGSLSRGNDASVRESLSEASAVRIKSIDISVGALVPVDSSKISALKDEKVTVKQAFDPKPFAESTVTLTASPVENLTSDVAFKVWSNPAPTKFHEIYPYYEYGEATYDGNKVSERNAMLYAASFNYTTSDYDLNGYYHVGHDSFETTGDVFNLSQEAFDIIGYDTSGSVAPVALEYIGKGLLSGLRVIGGPELWNGAKPQVLGNYWRTFPSSSVYFPEFSLGLVYAEEFGPSQPASEKPENSYGPGRKASIYGSAHMYPFATVKLAALYAGDEKVGAKYVDGKGNSKKITNADTLGGMVELGSEMLRYTYVYGRYIYRGLVADTGEQKVRGGFITGDSGSGNRQEFQFGADMAYGNFRFQPVARARMPLEAPKNRCLTDSYPSPFYVFDNRRAIEMEAVLTYDQEGSTWFHDWNADDAEGSVFAASLTGLYTLYAGPTDIASYDNGKGVWGSIGASLPEQRNLWAVGGKVISSPLPDLKLIGKLQSGHQGSTGKDTRIVDYWGGTAEVRWRNYLASGTYSRNAWGPEGWYRTFNVTYPAQWTLDFAYGFGKPSLLEATNRVGVKWQGWTYGKYSSDPFGAVSAPIDGKSYSELTFYFNVRL